MFGSLLLRLTLDGHGPQDSEDLFSEDQTGGEVHFYRSVFSIGVLLRKMIGGHGFPNWWSYLRSVFVG